jgi:acyl-CoA synthetase (AMP-forming)/AMP-acid ligase II
LAGFFGCAYAGAIAVPVHERLLPRLTAIVPDAQASFALTPAARQANTQAAVAGVDTPSLGYLEAATRFLNAPSALRPQGFRQA